MRLRSCGVLTCGLEKLIEQSYATLRLGFFEIFIFKNVDRKFLGTEFMAASLSRHHTTFNFVMLLCPCKGTFSRSDFNKQVYIILYAAHKKK